MDQKCPHGRRFITAVCGNQAWPPLLCTSEAVARLAAALARPCTAHAAGMADTRPASRAAAGVAAPSDPHVPKGSEKAVRSRGKAVKRQWKVKERQYRTEYHRCTIRFGVWPVTGLASCIIRGSQRRFLSCQWQRLISTTCFADCCAAKPRAAACLLATRLRNGEDGWWG